MHRNGKAQRPNALWVADFSSVATWAGFVHVAFVIDAFARRIVGWRGRKAPRSFVLAALAQALHDRRPLAGGDRVHPRERGLQDVSITSPERLAQAGVAPSVGRGGNSDDNARAKTVIGLVKTAVSRRLAPWRSRAALAWAALAWVDWCNHRRLGPRATIPPAEAETRSHPPLEDRALAA